jgi:hypothetical protein
MLVHPTLTDAEISKSCAVLDAVLSEASASGLSFEQITSGPNI